MAWSGLIRVWNAENRMYRKLVLRIEDTKETGCLVRIYDADRVVGNALEGTPEQAISRAVELAREYLHEDGLTEQSVEWMQV